MSFLHPSALYLLLAGLLILLFHFLRSRERQREVSSLLLWRGLPGDPQSRAARLRQHLDPLLLLQLGILIALCLTLAQPQLRVTEHSPSSLAIVIDGSVSMRTETNTGASRYEAAVNEAILLLGTVPPEETLVIQLTEHPILLSTPADLADPISALQASSPTWYADGSLDGLMTMLGSAGGPEQFDRILFLSDRVFPGLPANAETILFDEGANVGITAFAVRTNLTSSGVTEFVEILNATDDYLDATVRISDGENQATLALMLPPNDVDQYVIPFPASRGSVFSASVEYPDDLPADNVRHFALDRPIDVRVYWVGERNRYLVAALRATVPVTEVDDVNDADLIIVHRQDVPLVEQGVVLLVQSGMEGVVTLGEAHDVDTVTAASPEHTLLRSIDPDDLRVRQAFHAEFDVPFDVLLSADGMPLLAEVRDDSRRLLFLLFDLMNSNLPVTVDFPLLLRNLAYDLVRVPAALAFESPEVGDVLSLRGRGTVESVTDSADAAVEYSNTLLTFTPARPGVYTLTTDRGAFALTVNAPASETLLRNPSSQRPDETIRAESDRFLPMWPWFVLLAVLLLLIEAYIHLGIPLFSRRST